MVVGGFHPDLEKKVSECVLETEVCSSEEGIRRMKDFLKEHYQIEAHSAKETINLLMEKLGVKKESEIWENLKFKRYVGNQKADRMLTLFKPTGPSDSVDLINNVNIDQTLERWHLHGEKLFGKKFKNIPFQMIDFMDSYNTLSQLDLYETRLKYDCFGVIINTDFTGGRGKHWFAVYGDLTPEGTQENPYTIEYFNSSGRALIAEIEVWASKLIHELLRDHQRYANIVTAVNHRLQHSETECGVWSLMYIKSRLQGKPSNWFSQIGVNDQDIISLRKHLFR